MATSASATRPILPSIATLSSPHVTLFRVLLHVVRALWLCLSTFLPWHPAKLAVQRISVANTSIWWHDGKAYAGCESGPPMRILLPGMETAGWWTGAEHDPQSARGWSKAGLAGLFAEMTTAHPHVDPVSGELLLYHMSFFEPFLRVTVIPPRQRAEKAPVCPAPIIGRAVPGLAQPKQMHDFGVSASHTLILDLPLSLDPRNIVRGRPILHYDHLGPTRYGIFPRHAPEAVRWFEEAQACLIFHTANAWDDDAAATVSLLACRLNSATLIYSAGHTVPPPHALPLNGAPESCRLHYWRFTTDPSDASLRPQASFALSAIPFEFPTMNQAYSTRRADFIYGASMRSGSFDAGLGRKSAKIDCLAKIDAGTLLARAAKMSEAGETLGVDDVVDGRTVQELIAAQEAGEGADSAVRIFALPEHHYAQEATFVPRANATAEDDGWLVFFVFDESAGLDADGVALPNAQSELWVLEARGMQDVVARIRLPQRVPYGLHGHFFDAAEIAAQEPVPHEAVRTWARAATGGAASSAIVPAAAASTAVVAAAASAAVVSAAASPAFVAAAAPSALVPVST
jgi:carotenoid cleavage dioxygenase-like enzyme